MKVPISLAVLFRHKWVLLLGVAVGLSVGWAISRAGVSATSTFEVKALTSQPQFQSNRLALTYARLLPDDESVLATIGRSTNSSLGNVGSNLSITAVPDTNILLSRYTASDPISAGNGLQALRRAIRLDQEASGTRLARTVIPLTQPVTDDKVSGMKTVLIGGCCAFVLALLGCIAWERRRPHIERLRDLFAVIPFPVAAATERGAAEIVASLAGSRAEIDIVTVGYTRRQRRRYSENMTQKDRVPRGSTREFARALFVQQGAAASEVRQAWRECSANGPLVAAILVQREPVLHQISRRWRRR